MVNYKYSFYSFVPKTILYFFNLSNYEKTMYGMAIAFSEIGAFVIKDEGIPELSARFCLEEGLLRKALSFCPDGYIPYGLIKMGDELIEEDEIEKHIKKVIAKCKNQKGCLTELDFLLAK